MQPPEHVGWTNHVEPRQRRDAFGEQWDLFFLKGKVIEEQLPLLCA